MTQKETIKILNVPYIGIKVEAIPTILHVLNNSQNDNDFILYYENLGKKQKTITEYLASLRNLKLAERDKNGQTKINNSGKNILNDDIDLLYQNLLNHCLNKFPDLKIIKTIIKKTNAQTLNELIQALEFENYTIKRQQTLSSYFKFFKDANLSIEKIKKPHISTNENIEYMHLYKYIIYFSQKNNSNIIDFVDFKPFILSEYKGDESLIAKYLHDLSLFGKIRLYQIDHKPSTTDAYVCINNKIYSYFEVL